MTDSTPTIAIIGGGREHFHPGAPRRRYRQLDPSKTPNHLDIHVVDEVQPGEGKVWHRPDHNLCRHFAGVVTLFTEPGQPSPPWRADHARVDHAIRGELGSERDRLEKTDLFTRLSLSVEGEREP